MTDRNSSQRLSVPHMSAIYCPSCLAGQRLMSCLLGTHILYACVLPDRTFPARVFLTIVQKQKAFRQIAQVRYCKFAFSIFLYFISRRMYSYCRLLSSSGSGWLCILEATLERAITRSGKSQLGCQEPHFFLFCEKRSKKLKWGESQSWMIALVTCLEHAQK